MLLSSLCDTRLFLRVRCVLSCVTPPPRSILSWKQQYFELRPKGNIRSGNMTELVQHEAWLWNTSTKPVVIMWVYSPRSNWYVCVVGVGGRKQVDPWSSLTSQPNCLYETQVLWGNLSQKLRWSTFEDNAWSWPCTPHAHTLRAHAQTHEHTPMNKCTRKFTSAFHMHTQQICIHRHTNTHTHE